MNFKELALRLNIVADIVIIPYMIYMNNWWAVGGWVCCLITELQLLRKR